MFANMTLRQRFLGVGLVAFGLLLAIAGAGFWSALSLSGRMDQIGVTARALRNHLEAGKGFAVVASEVKSLANQTAKATEDISSQIASIQGATGDAAAAIKGIAETIIKVDEIATSIASAVEEQSAATQEIARNAQQAASGTSEVSSNVSGVTQAAAETGTASTQVLEAAKGLATQSNTLAGQVERFLKSLNAA